MIFHSNVTNRRIQMVRAFVRDDQRFPLKPRIDQQGCATISFSW